MLILVNNTYQLNNFGTENSKLPNDNLNSLNQSINKAEFNSNFIENFIENPNCGDCTCDNTNNKRLVPVYAKPTKLTKSPVQSISTFPFTVSLGWNNSVQDLDIHLKDHKGTDFPRDARHVTEFNNKVKRFEANGSNTLKLEVLQVRGILPKGRYLLYVYNCSNEKPMVFSKGFLRIFIDAYKMTANGKRRVRKMIYTLKISDNVFNINDRVWRIGFIQSDGKGKMLFKKIDKVSKNRAVFFDGLIETNHEDRPVVVNPTRKINITPHPPRHENRSHRKSNKVPKFSKKHGQKFCKTQCSLNYRGHKKKCFFNGVKDCRSCKYKHSFVKSQESKELNHLCKSACNLVIGESSCQYYPYINSNHKIFNQHLIAKHILRKLKRNLYRLLGK